MLERAGGQDGCKTSPPAKFVRTTVAGGAVLEGKKVSAELLDFFGFGTSGFWGACEFCRTVDETIAEMLELVEHSTNPNELYVI